MSSKVLFFGILLSLLLVAQNRKSPSQSLIEGIELPPPPQTRQSFWEKDKEQYLEVIRVGESKKQNPDEIEKEKKHRLYLGAYLSDLTKDTPSYKISFFEHLTQNLNNEHFLKWSRAGLFGNRKNFLGMRRDITLIQKHLKQIKARAIADLVSDLRSDTPDHRNLSLFLKKNTQMLDPKELIDALKILDFKQQNYIRILLATQEMNKLLEDYKLHLENKSVFDAEDDENSSPVEKSNHLLSQ